MAKPAHWYDPYVIAAESSGIYKKGDFSSTDWTKSMTRLEMVHTAVRATDETGKDDYEFMYIAAKKGLISGIGNGNLNPDGTTTRAQAVTVIQRIQQVRDGKTLPVDQLALANAEKAKNAKRDAWGRVIRTTNLPKNYKDYPYILEGLPNEMYQMPHENNIGTSKTAAELASDSRMTKAVIDGWITLVNQYGKLSLNVDYKTIGQNWFKDYLAVLMYQGEMTSSHAMKYVSWVRENHIQIEGTLTPEPSMVFIRDGCIVVRSQIKFRIKNFDKNEKIFNDLWFRDNTYKMNTWYEGYTDIELSSNVWHGGLMIIKYYGCLYFPCK